jgi:hypothetical protein
VLLGYGYKLKTKNKNLLNKVMDENFYTITQVLGKYYDSDFSSHSLPLLHPLLYASRSTYKGSMDRYSKEECSFPISKKEFEKFVIENDPVQFAVFIEEKDFLVNRVRFEAFTIIKKYHDAYLVEAKVARIFYNNDLSLNQMNISANYPLRLRGNLQEGSNLLDKKEVFLSILTHVSSRSQISKFYSPNTEISFDVVTIYEILTNRGSCTTITKNYAKKMTLDIFNRYMALLDRPDSVHAVNLYLQTNAYILGIDESFYSTLLTFINYMPDEMHESVLEDYINKTFDQRLNLIDMIRKTILSLD